jgi:hypothetical protein
MCKQLSGSEVGEAASKYQYILAKGKHGPAKRCGADETSSFKPNSATELLSSVQCCGSRNYYLSLLSLPSYECETRFWSKSFFAFRSACRDRDPQQRSGTETSLQT